LEENNLRNNGVEVRAATVEDAREIAAVHIASWRGGYPELMPAEMLDALSLDERERQWQHWLAPGGERAQTLLADTHSALAGFSTLAVPSRDADEPPGCGEIHALYVDPAAWGVGAGSALMDASLESLRAQGCDQAILWMLEGNERAAGFYAKRGWRTDGGRRGSQYYPDTPELIEIRYRRAL
jgi:ribosomal protein S18 acetylase RimI-like enzyme